MVVSHLCSPLLSCLQNITLQQTCQKIQICKQPHTHQTDNYSLNVHTYLSVLDKGPTGETESDDGECSKESITCRKNTIIPLMTVSIKEWHTTTVLTNHLRHTTTVLPNHLRSLLQTHYQQLANLMNSKSCQ